MSIEWNKAIVHQFLASWNRGDMRRAWRSTGRPTWCTTPRNGTYESAQVFSRIAGFMQAFPDLQFKIENMVAEGDFVATRMTARATHRQEFMGVPASGKQISCTVMVLVRLAGGRIVEHWNVIDELYLLQQIGPVPEDHLKAMASS